MMDMMQGNNTIEILSKLTEHLNECNESYKLLDIISKDIEECRFIECIELFSYDSSTSSLKDFIKTWIKLDKRENSILYEAYSNLDSNTFILNSIKYSINSNFNFINNHNEVIMILQKSGIRIGLIRFTVKSGEKSCINLLLLIRNYISLIVSNLMLTGKMQDSIEFYTAMRNIAKIIENQYDPAYVIPILGEVIDRFIPDHLIYVFNKDEDSYKLAWPKACREEIIYQNLVKLSPEQPCILLKENQIGLFGLISENTVIGAVVAYSNFEKLNNQQIDYIIQLTKQAGITLQRAYVYAEILQHATLDALTGLNNRRQFEIRLNQEIANTKRKSSSLCCIMIDIDHFKKVNDTYGHLVGDIVLKNISKIIQNALREYDIASRYGGEEFIILLPTTTIDEATFVAQRLRKTVEDASIDISSANIDIKKLKVTISVGVSEFDLIKDTPESFYIKADDALYRAKNSGRNKVIAIRNSN